MQDAAIKPFFVARRCSGREANGSPRERGQLYLARRDLLRAPFGAIAVRCRRGSFRHAVVIVASRAAVAILHQGMNVGLEAGKLLVEIACEFQIADDGGVEAITRNQQLVARRISTDGGPRSPRLAQPFQRTGRTGAIPQQPFQTLALVRLDAHVGIDREAAAVLPLGHHLRVVCRPRSCRRPPCSGRYRLVGIVASG